MTNVSSSSSVWRSWVATSGSIRRSVAGNGPVGSGSSVIYQMCLAIFPDWRTLHKYITCLHRWRTHNSVSSLDISEMRSAESALIFAHFARPSYIFEWIWLPPVGNICCLGWESSQRRLCWCDGRNWVLPTYERERGYPTRVVRCIEGSQHFVKSVRYCSEFFQPQQL